MFNVIIWASDGSAHADRALDYAQKLAEASSAKLVVTHVREVTVGRAAGYPVQPDEAEIEAKIQGQAQALKDAGIDVEYVQAGATVGGAAHAIADLAAERNADLIAVGTRGRSGLRRMLLGSIAERVVHHAPCPVLTVRRPDPAEPMRLSEEAEIPA